MHITSKKILTMLVSEFNKIIDGNNSVAQNAYYHLGESYINARQKTGSLECF